MLAAGTPAARARRTSCPELASMCRPIEANSWRMAAFGDAFMAYRTVSPYACGNASAASACARRPPAEYANAGVPTAARTPSAWPGVRNRSPSLGVSFAGGGAATARAWGCVPRPPAAAARAVRAPPRRRCARAGRESRAMTGPLGGCVPAVPATCCA